MASVVSSEENFDDSLSEFSQCSFVLDENSLESGKPPIPEERITCNANIVRNLFSRQTYGRVTKNPKAKTEKLFKEIHPNCKFKLGSLIRNVESLSHVFMGFTICTRYFLSFTERIAEEAGVFMFNPTYEYELHLWRFNPGKKLEFVSKYKLFKHLQGGGILDKIIFMQFPLDPHKIICYGLAISNAAMYITILTIPSPRCKHCKGDEPSMKESTKQGWCSKHGFIMHYLFSMSQPCPSFDPHVSLAHPDHLVINTGHYIHILNVTTLEPPQNSITLHNIIKEDETKTPNNFNNDTLSEVSESASEHYGNNSIIEAILEDFSEYDLEGSECNKPFHELNISCEPLNVTGKSYHNTLVQNIVDPRVKRLQNNKDYLFSVPQTSGVQKTVEKSKIDIKTAEKAYEFTEENEKCEKLSSFRKKRLAEKKYEFSEDNTENIVPFNSLRRERRFFHRTRYMRSPDFNSLFLSPRSPGMRSPMQSPNSRNGQFSPSSGRNLYCTSLRNSPHHSKSPISPKEAARKFYVYSPSLDSDCSDSDSRLVLKLPGQQVANQQATNGESRINQHNGLLIVDPARESCKWIKKVVRRYSNGDFENSSLLSGQSRDDYNIPIEIPLLVQTLTDQHLDVVPDFKVDHLTQMQLIVTQRTFDCEQFVQRKAQELCVESQLEFLHCEDYDIKLIHVCPMEGHVICQAVIKIGALNRSILVKPETYTTSFIFSWNIITDLFEMIESVGATKLQLSRDFKHMQQIKIPPTNCKSVLVMDYHYSATKTVLRDHNNDYEVSLLNSDIGSYVDTQEIFSDEFSLVSDSD